MGLAPSPGPTILVLLPQQWLGRIPELVVLRRQHGACWAGTCRQCHHGRLTVEGWRD